MKVIVFLVVLLSGCATCTTIERSTTKTEIQERYTCKPGNWDCKERKWRGWEPEINERP